jgi:L-lactate dehydrogenase complex protein LldE
MRIGLFIPCYIDQFYPNVAIATYELLVKLGCEIEYPLGQTCCGQPLANSGYQKLTGGCDANFVRNFAGFDYVVAPSGSCVLHIKEHLSNNRHEAEARHLRENIYELTEFLTDVLKVPDMQNASFPYRVGMHVSCHGQRGLHLSSMSETRTPSFSKPDNLLRMVKGLDLVHPERPDECCGFGGTFCVTEDAVSVKMGSDRIREHAVNEVDFITAGDTSCLMHLEGILKRQGSRIKTIHIAEILNSEV